MNADPDARTPPTPDRFSERAVALALAGAVAFAPPVLGVFSTPRTIAGIPVLYAWLFGAWSALLVALALAAERSR